MGAAVVPPGVVPVRAAVVPPGVVPVRAVAVPPGVVPRRGAALDEAALDKAALGETPPHPAVPTVASLAVAVQNAV
jgi:hypothetical protein